ncbi:MAG TPA: hypothetical protein VM536_23480, partial [Chloroflexia bacterium]|nr:hypothetical protein [Chloroflexia bacterium]
MPKLTTPNLSLFTLALIAAISLILTLPLALPGRVELAVGQPATTDVFAPQDIRYTSELLTAQDREAARNAVGPVYDYNGSLVESQRRRLGDILNTIETARGNQDNPDPARGPRLRQQLPVELTDADIAALLDAPADRYS